MFFLADKAYRVRAVPPLIRTVWSIPPALSLACAAAFSAVVLIWVAMWV